MRILLALAVLLILSGCTSMLLGGSALLVLGERPGWNAFGGMALIFTGLVVIDGRLLKRLRHGRRADP